MAKKDVRKYFANMQAQYLETKNDLADFEQALKDEYITEDKLQAVKDEFFKIEVNYYRLLYIVHLLDKPAFTLFKKKYKAKNADLEAELKDNLATEEDVATENKEAQEAIKTEFDRLKEDSK